MSLAAQAGARPADLWPPRRPVLRALVMCVLALVLLAGLLLPGSPAAAQQHDVRLRIAGTDPLTWDPASAGDAGSAAVIAQVFEGLTAFDAQSQVQPALASEWSVQEDGRRIVFTLRPGLLYSDGSPIRAQDVVDSWFRLLDPEQPSPLVGLLSDVEGATGYVQGTVPREQVGLHAEGETVVVDFRRPATYFLAVTASPSLAVVPPAVQGQRLSADLPPGLVVSGAYRPTSQTEAGIRLESNPHYWAGSAPLAVIEIATDLGGASPVDAFEDGAVDYTPVGSYDASWIRYDATMGPQLRQTESFSTHYYGFDTTTAPFDDERVRLAFAQAVNWERIVRLATEGEPAGSLVPPGIPGRGEEDFRPRYDPDAARRLLADAGYPNGDGFPDVPLVSFGYGYEPTVASELEATLGVDVSVEIMEFSEYSARLAGDDRPPLWTLSWIADYPHAHDFLGLLLETGSASNAGGWSNAEYDALIEAAAATNDPDEQARYYTEAQRILQREAPVIPVEYGESWALSRDGLLGALESGVGMIRFAGLDWAEGTGR
ncbi:MAG TPA: peptide ABC transporter substrate-binding protein [Candidatus Caenarcaniphilales bacterium]|nr:peptide ABC transporter substrate-binding protein [Candidatus Caenarcaniphilales bacterium]